MFKIVPILSEERNKLVEEIGRMLLPLTDLMEKPFEMVVDADIDSLRFSLYSLLRVKKDSFIRMGKFQVAQDFMREVNGLIRLHDALEILNVDHSVTVQLGSLLSELQERKYSITERVYNRIESEIYTEMESLDPDGDFFIYDCPDKDNFRHLIHIIVSSKNINILPIAVALSQRDNARQMSFSTTRRAYEALLLNNEFAPLAELVEYISLATGDCLFQIQSSANTHNFLECKIKTPVDPASLYKVAILDDLSRKIYRPLPVSEIVSIEYIEHYFDKRIEYLIGINRIERDSGPRGLLVLLDLAIGFGEVPYILYKNINNSPSNFSVELSYEIETIGGILPGVIETSLFSVLPILKDKRFPLTCKAYLEEAAQKLQVIPSKWDDYLIQRPNRSIPVLLDQKTMLDEGLLTEVGSKHTAFSGELLQSNLYGKSLYNAFTSNSAVIIESDTSGNLDGEGDF